MDRPDPATLPLAPGVYVFKDGRGRVIYVGKARMLRRRVLSYFRPDGVSPKTRAMMGHARNMTWIPTNTEKEALLLEASLIKRHRPHYNIVLRDDKQYVLFRIPIAEPFPRLEIVRRATDDGSLCFGPFPSTQAARETWKLLHRAFGLRRCSDVAMRNRVRPCLYHHIAHCPAPCVGQVTPEAYQAEIRKVCELLQGQADFLLDQLRAQMEEASEAMEYERAAVLRDQMRAVEGTLEQQSVVLPGASDMDALCIHGDGDGLALGIVFVRGGAVMDGRNFFWPGLELADADELLASFLVQYYGNVLPPPRVVVPFLPRVAEEEESEGGETEGGEAERSAALQEQILSQRRNGPVRIVLPQDERDVRLVDLALANAREAVRCREDPMGPALATLLGRTEPVRRIECVDVSHTGGTQTRVGLVVFEHGRPSKNDYRIYSMPDSADDCATLFAWTARRLESGPPWPDLLLIDGGRGQLDAVRRGLTGEESFALAAIAKARDERGHADRRAGNVADRIFVPGRVNPLNLREGSAELLFLQNVRDAAHRFAVSRHRKARTGAALSGELTRLPGVGPATARLLWERFKDVQGMRQATIEELESIPGIGKMKAKALLENLALLGKD
ncbi:MAG: excinuclease ABC subunit UvrC [Desulfovibrio sp.]|jgi:excinuclease ABC subunit C|nr:excinuclease ABC subunit UvrC [Desulfovibrio sp.]